MIVQGNELHANEFRDCEGSVLKGSKNKGLETTKYHISQFCKWKDSIRFGEDVPPLQRGNTSRLGRSNSTTHI